MAARRSRSRKPSGASSSSKPPEPPVFFIDRSLGKIQVAEALRKTGLQVNIHDDHFAVDAKDEEWLAKVGSHGWVVLSKDKRIRTRTLERDALMNAGVRAFILTAGELQGKEMAEAFLQGLPAMLKLLSKNPGPFIATITRSGTVSVLPS